MEIRKSYKPEDILAKRQERKTKVATTKKINKKQPKPHKVDKKAANKKIKQTPNERLDKKKLTKKVEREEKNEGKLLQQLLLIQQRMERMDKDKERYCLVNWQKEEGKRIYRFSIVREQEPYILKIDVKPDYNTVCNCMDWRTRCRNQMIPCKHIYYLLSKILGYELFDYFDNQIMCPEVFEKLVGSKLAAKRNMMQNKELELGEKECPICFMDFAGHDVKLVKVCSECRSCTHDDCARMWLMHSIKKNCPICGSEAWKNNVN